MKLSICIPTYNRKEKVAAQIKRIVESRILSDIKDVELVVSDNCSEDNTYDELLSIYGEEPRIRFFCQDNNLGLVGNLYFLFGEARGEYVWFLSDDDPVNPDSINKVLALLTESPRAFYLLNFQTDQDDSPYWKYAEDILSLFNDKTWGGFGLLSVQVLKKDSYSDFYKSTSSIYNLCQPVAVSLYGLLFLDGIMCFDIISITHHVGNYSWMNKAREVFSKDLYYSVAILKRYNSPHLYNKIIAALRQLKLFNTSSFVYILKSANLKYIFDLAIDRLLPSVLVKGGFFSIRSKTKALLFN